MGVAAQAQLIDAFSSTDLSAYTLSRVNDANTITNVSFSAPSGTLGVFYSATPNAVEQVLFLRGDYSLGVGQMLVADVLGTPVNWDRDFGIAVGYTATPPSLAPGASGDVRNSYVEVSVRANNQVVSFGRDVTLNEQSGQEFAGTSYGGVSFTAYPTSLFIARISPIQFQVGWIQGGTMHILTANGTALNGVGYYSITNNTPGAAVGFYGDVRAAIAGSPSQLDNLRIELIPEPATFALVGLGLGALVLRRKRA